MLELLSTQDMLSNMVQLTYVVLQTLHTINAPSVRAASLAYGLGIPTTETDIWIALICLVGLHTDGSMRKKLPGMEVAAAYVDLGNDSSTLAFETSFAPTGVYYAQHA